MIQACSKAIRCDDYYDNESLIEELGDVNYMIELMHQYDLVSLKDLVDRGKIKEEKLKKWSSLIES